MKEKKKRNKRNKGRHREQNDKGKKCSASVDWKEKSRIWNGSVGEGKFKKGKKNSYEENCNFDRVMQKKNVKGSERKSNWVSERQKRNKNERR